MQRPDQSKLTRAGAAWGLIAGAAGGLCCLGPAAAALLGLGASSALAGLQLGRAPAAALSAALLAAGLALALRRGARCGLSPARRLRAPLLMLAVFGVSYAALAYALPAVAAGRLAAEVRAPAAGPPEAAARRLTLSVEKMDCPPCVVAVRKLLAEQPGVTGFVAEPENDEVVIDYLPGQIDAAALALRFPSSYGVSLLSDVALP